MRHAVAINSVALNKKIPPGDPLWATFNDSFDPLMVETIELANEIYSGHAYCGHHRGRRKLENFVQSGFLAVDMDTGDERSSFDSLHKNDLVSIYAGLIHTTPSHTSQSPRARIIFLLDQAITSVDEYRDAARFLISQFDGADQSCTDASRFFYGSQGCNIWFTDNILPIATLRHFYRDWIKKQTKPARRRESDDERNTYTEHDDYQENISSLIYPVEHAQQGNRNNTLNTQAFLAGKNIRQGRIRESEIVPRLLEAALRIGLDEHEANATIRSGINGGIRSH